MYSSAEEQLQQAIEDIKEWLQDHQAASFVDRLAPGASASTIARAEAALGKPLPALVRHLYLLHNGQSGEVEPLFEHMFFLPLEEACRQQSIVVECYVRPPEGYTLRDYHSQHPFVADEELQSNHWFPFANTDRDYLAVHLDSGRVFRFRKGDLPWMQFEAPNFGTFVGDYASRLWDDGYQLHGDPAQPGVVASGLVWLSRYLARA